MKTPLRAMLWALAIIFVALLSARGAIGQSSATTLMIVLPLLATLQLGGRMGPCPLAKGRD